MLAPADRSIDNQYSREQVMINQFIQSGFTKVLVFTVITVQLVACGGGSGGGSSDEDRAAISDIVGSAGESGNTDPVNTAPVLTSSVTLGWTAPATRADGTPLSLADIDGFRIYYGESAGNYNNSVEVADGTAQTVTINNIPVGTYQVVITAFDVNGSESGFSSEIPIAIQ